MKITFNNIQEEINRDSITIEELLNEKKYTFRMRIVKINGKLIPRDKYDETLIHDGDEVQMLYLMSGG